MRGKKIIKKGLRSTFRSTKKVIKTSPQLTKYARYVKKTIGKYFGADTSSWGPIAQQLAYARWVNNNYPDALELRYQKTEVETFTYKPIISLLVPTYNTNEAFLKECIESIQTQSYPYWELCIADDASPNNSVRDIIKQYAKNDDRIKYTFRKKNGHISETTNDALKISTGEYIGLVDHDDILWPNALYEVAKVLNNDKSTDFVYTDEDKVTENRHSHRDPFFKPDWNPDFLHCVNYITHFSVIRKSLVEEVGGLQTKYNGAQDWNLFLRVSNLTDKIKHVPKILYSWRISETSTALSTDTKPYVYEAQRHAVQDDLVRKGYTDAIVKNDALKDCWQVVYPIKDNPKVSIIIPTKNKLTLLKKCIDSIEKKTSYKNYEVVIVDTGSTDMGVRQFYKKLESRGNYKIVEWAEKPFSYSRSCNEGARQADGEFLLMLNNDTEVLTADWIQLMLGDAQRKEIGAVGCKLYYEDGVHLQHAGVWVGPQGTAAHVLSGMSDHAPMTLVQYLYANTAHNLSVVTAACMMIEKKKFNLVGGFDEKDFQVTYSDVDLCLKLRKKGLQNFYNPHVKLIHHESVSIGEEGSFKRDHGESKLATKAFQKKWASYVEHDPSFNLNLDKSTANLDIAVIE